MYYIRDYIGILFPSSLLRTSKYFVYLQLQVPAAASSEEDISGNDHLMHPGLTMDSSIASCSMSVAL